ncbi:hypothetical protein BRD04_02540 [Halobacteriales archaeon QS_9_67_17]|nr:MAG: hypothetical protein BRD04_02540 [Halobacteriales archaeon QS_9_67_17]
MADPLDGRGLVRPEVGEEREQLLEVRDALADEVLNVAMVAAELPRDRVDGAVRAVGEPLEDGRPTRLALVAEFGMVVGEAEPVVVRALADPVPVDRRPVPEAVCANRSRVSSCSARSRTYAPGSSTTPSVPVSQTRSLHRSMSSRSPGSMSGSSTAYLTVNASRPSVCSR